MRRREFLTLLGGAAVCWPIILGAQSPRSVRIGVVSTINPRTAWFWVAFDKRMRELGYIEGENFSFDFVNLGGQLDRYSDETRGLVGRKADIILTSGPEVGLKSALEATNTIPIVMIAVDYDPLALGYVPSLARPGGNVTGLFFQQIDLTVKRLQLVKDARLPRLYFGIAYRRISGSPFNGRARRSVCGLQVLNSVNHRTISTVSSPRHLPIIAELSLSSQRRGWLLLALILLRLRYDIECHRCSRCAYMLKLGLYPTFRTSTAHYLRSRRRAGEGHLSYLPGP